MPSTRSGDAVASAWKWPSSSSESREVGLERRVEQSLREAERTGRARPRACARARAPRAAARRRRRRTGTRARGRRLRRRSRLRRASPSPWRAGGRRGGGAGTRRPRRRRGPTCANDQMKRVRGCTSTKSHASARCAPGPDRRAVHRRDRRLVELPELADERLHAGAQRLRGRARRRSRACPACATVDAPRSMPAQNASPSPVMSTARTCGSARNSRTASMMPSRIATVSAFFASGRSSTMRPTPSGSRSTRRCVCGHDASFRLVRMLTTDTPEPRPPALCWSA